MPAASPWWCLSPMSFPRLPACTANPRPICQRAPQLTASSGCVARCLLPPFLRCSGRVQAAGRVGAAGGIALRLGEKDAQADQGLGGGAGPCHEGLLRAAPPLSSIYSRTRRQKFQAVIYEKLYLCSPTQACDVCTQHASQRSECVCACRRWLLTAASALSSPTPHELRAC